MQFRRVVAVLALALGALGVVACAVASVYVCRGSSRVNLANEEIFAAIDKALGLVEKRVHTAQERVRESKVTTAELAEKLQDWATNKAVDRIAAKFEVEQRTEKLSQQLQTIDVWIETSSASIADVKQVLMLGSSLGAKLDLARADNALRLLAEVRSAVQRMAGAVSDVREFVKGQSDSNATDRITALLARILLTIADVDTRLQVEVSRLNEFRTESAELKVRTGNSISWIVRGCYGLLAWIALGQASLFRCGWKRLKDESQNETPCEHGQQT